MTARQPTDDVAKLLTDLLDEVRAIRLYVQLFLLIVVLGGAYLIFSA